MTYSVKVTYLYVRGISSGSWRRIHRIVGSEPIGCGGKPVMS